MLFDPTFSCINWWLVHFYGGCQWKRWSFFCVLKRNKLRLFSIHMSQCSISADRLTGPAGGAHDTPPGPLAGFKEAYFWLHRSLSLTKNNVIFFVVFAVIMFSHSGKQTNGHCYHNSPLPKTSSLIKNAQNFFSWFSEKSVKLLRPAVRF